MLAECITRITKGKLLSGEPDVEIEPSDISTDSRMIKKGGFFIALKGPNYDGNDFVGDAFEKGAVGALVGRVKGHPSASLGTGVPRVPPSPRGLRRTGKSRKKILIETKDTTRALQAIAANHRNRFDIPVICVTGSNGKTTVKDMISHVLSQKYSVLKTEGTKNNHIGVPQTLLKIKKSHDICVLELGANHGGEIRRLAEIARPDTVVITNIGLAHLKFFHNLEGVFEAKKEALESLGRSGLAIINGDDPFLLKIKSGPFKIIRFGMKETNDFFAKSVSLGKEKVKFTLFHRRGISRPIRVGKFEMKLLGLHSVYNALAAVAVASQFDVSCANLKRAFYYFSPPHMRLNPVKVKGLEIINDSYNSNPSSMRSALDILDDYPAESKWVVMGDMLELGKRSGLFHRDLGERIAKSDIQGLVTMGRLSRYTYLKARACGMNSGNLWHCSNHHEVARILKRRAKKGDAVLFKGSRAMEMEKVIEKL